jgi:hypothetical protein
MGRKGGEQFGIMSKSFRRFALSVATATLCAMVVLSGPMRAGAHKALLSSEWDWAADVSSLCASHGWGPMDTGTAILIRALTGATSVITVTILTELQQCASFPAARAVAWTAAIFLHVIAINYSGEAIIVVLNWDGVYEDFARIALPFLAGGIFWVASIWATGRIFAGSPKFRASFKLRHRPARLSPNERQLDRSLHDQLWRRQK